MKNSNDTIGNRTHDLPACSAVPQPTAPPRAPLEATGTLDKQANKYVAIFVEFCWATSNIWERNMFSENVSGFIIS